MLGITQLPQFIIDHLNGLTATGHSSVVSGNNDGVAALEGEHGVAHGSHDGVGAGGNGGYDTNRLCNTSFFIGIKNATGLFASQVVPNNTSLLFVLSDLIFNIAHAGLFHSQLCQILRIFVNDLTNGFYGQIDLLLGHLLKFRLSCAGSRNIFVDILHALFVFGHSFFLHYFFVGSIKRSCYQSSGNGYAMRALR